MYLAYNIFQLSNTIPLLLLPDVYKRQGIGTAVVGWMLEFSGYVGTNVTQPQSALDMMQFMYLWLPLIFDVLIMFVLSRMNVEDVNKKLKAEKGIAADEITDASDIN